VPIYDHNESALLVTRGSNWVWQDAARHRAEPTYRSGPHGKATPYRPQYTLDAGLDMEMLEHLQPFKQLMGVQPVQTALAVRGRRNDAELAVANRLMQHALPGPVADMIISAAKFRKGREWHRIKNGKEWAEYTLKKASAYLEAYQYHDAALNVAEVYGYYLAGAVHRALNEDEYDLLERSWSVLQYLTDPHDLMRRVVDGFNMSADDATRWAGISVTLHEIVEQHTGPMALRMAATVSRKQQEYDDYLDLCHQQGLPAGHPDMAEVMFTIPGVDDPGPYWLASDIIEFPALDNVCGITRAKRYAVWVFPFRRGTYGAGEVIRLRSSMAKALREALQAKGANKWERLSVTFNFDPVSKLLRPHNPVAVESIIDTVDCPRKPPIAALTPWYNGRHEILERQKYLKAEYELAQEKYLRATEGTTLEDVERRLKALRAKAQHNENEEE
jgi:hypothetical protein